MTQVGVIRDQKIYDAVHGFIRFNALEKELIHSEPFQRLRSIHQLGITYFVYPGATHTRFEHSLGTMELATRIFDRIQQKGFEVEHADYWLQVIRLAALCHDLGHLPFSHDAEQALLKGKGHEEWTLKVIQSECLQPIWSQLQKLFPKKNVIDDLIKMAIGEKTLIQLGLSLPFSELERILSAIITADFFGADRIDYLLRDAKCTGVTYGLFDHQQMIEMLSVLSQGDELTLGIEEDGIEACEALVLARHFMSQRVYQYSSVKAYQFHLVRVIKQFYEEGRYLNDLQSYLSVSDHEILTSIRCAAKDPTSFYHQDAIALLKRQERFLAISISEGTRKEQLLEIKKGLNIPDEEFFLEEQLLTSPLPTFGFSVLSRSGVILPASALSSLLIPRKKSLIWVYLAPKWEEVFRKAIGKIE